MYYIEAQYFLLITNITDKLSDWNVETQTGNCDISVPVNQLIRNIIKTAEVQR